MCPYVKVIGYQDMPICEKEKHRLSYDAKMHNSHNMVATQWDGWL